jgi:hypothetical protein
VKYKGFYRSILLFKELYKGSVNRTFFCDFFFFFFLHRERLTFGNAIRSKSSKFKVIISFLFICLCL